MGHVITDILNEYELDLNSDLDIRLKDIQPSEWKSILNKLEKAYSNNALTSIQQGGLTPMTFSFPALPAPLLPSISSQLLVADKTWIDDPLYDTLLLVDQVSDINKLRDIFPTNLSNAKLIHQVLYPSLLYNLKCYIEFYLKAKDLILENRLIPYKNIAIPDWTNRFVELLNGQIQSDRNLRKSMGIPTGFSSLGILAYAGIMMTIGKTYNTVSSRILHALPNSYANRLENAGIFTLPEKARTTTYKMVGLPQLASNSLQMQAILPSLIDFIANRPRGLSTDLVSKEMAYLYRQCLSNIEIINNSLPQEEKIPALMKISQQSFQLPMINNVPVEYVLDTVSKEWNAFESYRALLNERFLKLSAPAGSAEREREIIQIQESIRGDIAAISEAHKNIISKLGRRLSINLTLGTFGVAVTGLGVSAQNLDFLAIVGSVAGGTALVTAAKEIAKDYAVYKEELQELKLHQNYFIWKLHSRKRT
jgi:hypothetical protein